MIDLEPIRQLIADARALLAERWDPSRAENVCERAEQLTEPLNDPRHGSLAEAALGFAAYLSAFTESSAGPMEAKRVQMEALLESVNEQLQRLETSTALELMTPEPEPPAPAPSPAGGEPAEPVVAAPAAVDTIVFIDPTGRDAGVLGMELEEFGYQVQPLLRLDRPTGHWLNQPQVKALILPVAGLDVWEKLVQLDPSLDAARRRIGLFVVSRSDDPRLRLRASQSAADGFFVLPGAVDALAREIVEVLRDRLDPYRAMVIDDDVSMTMVVESVLKRSGM
ncbi:MAG: hypothetical protein JNL89_08010, partial [Rhodanobacteraceae bacterium]|nr:hypothetical protein [Rhodanobacteraceae bacterium]